MAIFIKQLNKLMKKVSCASAMILLIITNSFGQQDINSLKGFKYAYVSVLTYDGGRVDIFGITDFIKKELEIKGIKVLNNDINEWPQEAKLNNCLVGNWFPTHSPGGIPNSANGGFIVKNCKGEIVYQNSSFASHFGYFYNKNVPYAVEKAFKIIRTMNYFFDQSFTPKIDYPEVENTTETEESIKQYLSSNKLDPIEGIYKSYQDSHLGYYKVGIIKAEDKFKVIIIETELPQWKAGEVKAYCEFSSMKGIYSTKWYKSNKMAEETFSSLENDAILTVELKDPKGEKY
ncbi:MAG TPA: hypothetical protein DGG95_13295, partial [Cytophagales bacterium]|nr:hypothetical protein [Cytophagales bacterium]